MKGQADSTGLLPKELPKETPPHSGRAPQSLVTPLSLSVLIFKMGTTVADSQAYRKVGYGRFGATAAGFPQASPGWRSNQLRQSSGRE
jgi:hypothetical protein